MVRSEGCGKRAEGGCAFPPKLASPLSPRFFNDLLPDD